ncbi:MAG TPA: WD40 repeat domain-containing protein [Bradyrhizobium sp.]|nr:WD40 repeat domain-containing protein [Bradyrhizobium sp.]
MADAKHMKRRLLLSSFAALLLAAGGAYLLEDKFTVLGLRVARLHSLTTKVSPTGIAWSPDGEKIAAIHDFGRAISVWNTGGDLLITIKRELTTGPYVGSSLAFMPDGRSILAPAPTPTHYPTSSLGLWDVQTGALQRVVPAPSSDKIFQEVLAGIFVVSPDGTLVAFRPIHDVGPISIYRTDDWSLLKTRPIFESETRGLKPSAITGETRPDFPDIVTALAFAPNNDLAVGLIDGLAMMGSSSSILQYIEGRTVRSLAYSPNGQFVATGIGTMLSSTSAAHLVHLQIREVASGSAVVNDNTIGDVRNLAWDREGQILAVVTTDETVHLYRPFASGSAHQDMSVSKGAFTLAFSPTKSELAVSTGTGVDIYSVR